MVPVTKTENRLKHCPLCGFELSGEGRYQICKRCSYWTQCGSVRLDPLII